MNRGPARDDSQPVIDGVVLKRARSEGALLRAWCGANMVWVSPSTSLLWLLPRRSLPLRLILALALIATGNSLALAQRNPFWSSNSGPSFEVSNQVQVDELNSSGKKQLEQVREFLDNKQWSEAIDILRRLMETHGDKLVAVDEHRYLNVRDYCQLQLSRLPPTALETYRQLADPAAKQWFEDGLARRDPQRLQMVVNQAFCSRYGDDALLALGDIALEAGDASRARSYWERILGTEAESTTGATRLAYPDTDLNLAEVHARIVLVSLLEGAPQRAKWELEHSHPLLSAATGRLAGRSGNYFELLSKLVDSVVPEPIVESDANWLTFAGANSRQHPILGEIDIGAPAWKQTLKYGSLPSDFKSPPRRVADSMREPLSYHPLVIGNLVFVLTRLREEEHDRNSYVHDLQVFDLRTGKPAWGDDHLTLPVGQRTSNHSPTALGVPRYTLTAYENKLLLRLGYPVTCVSTRQDQRFLTLPQSLVCLDLEQEGKVLWSIHPGEEMWSFEGAPVCDGTNVYIAQRRSDIRPQAHVAAYDLQSGELRWRRFISAAETPGQGQMDEITHNLLTLVDDRLYFNTNLGAIAALDTRAGRTLWVYHYDRKGDDSVQEQNLHCNRDLNPCVVYRGRLFVAPADHSQVMALNADTGEFLWQTEAAYDVMHLLGIVNGKLVASGDKLYFFQVDPFEQTSPKLANDWRIGGKQVATFFGSGRSVDDRGFGRGVIVGQKVYFPTHTALHVVDASLNPPALVRNIELQQTRGVSGGNLTVAGGHLLITTSDQIVAFEQIAGEKRSTAPDAPAAAP